MSFVAISDSSIYLLLSLPSQTLLSTWFPWCTARLRNARLNGATPSNTTPAIVATPVLRPMTRSSRSRRTLCVRTESVPRSGRKPNTRRGIAQRLARCNPVGFIQECSFRHPRKAVSVRGQRSLPSSKKPSKRMKKRKATKKVTGTHGRAWHVSGT